MRDKPLCHAPETEMQRKMDVAAAEQERERRARMVPEQAGLFYGKRRGPEEIQTMQAGTPADTQLGPPRNGGPVGVERSQRIQKRAEAIAF